MKFSDLKFLLKNGHLPETYRKLFRNISSLYLTPTAPGKALVAGLPVCCTTNSKRLTIKIDFDDVYFIDRDTLDVFISWKAGSFTLHHPAVARLKTVLDSMLKHGIPFKMSDTNVTHLGI